MKRKIISVFDNTGYRLSCGTPLNIFTTESEATESYNLQRTKIKNDMILHIKDLKHKLEKF